MVESDRFLPVVAGALFSWVVFSLLVLLPEEESIEKFEAAFFGSGGLPGRPLGFIPSNACALLKLVIVFFLFLLLLLLL